MQEMNVENNTERERPSFEQALKELEHIVQELEKEDVSLERSIELYQKGVELSKECSDLLEKAELKIQEVQSSSN
jgi:exodeoxyribonuclease VII small subunit|tara:strand:+ start:127 stop:351 length:225 start_codon:yes stop_codon:yes gene_type:complete